jgi:ribosomal protein L24
LFNFQKFNFARLVPNFVPIFTGDKVMVLPPWGTAKISKFAKLRLRLHQRKEMKIKLGTVLKVLRKKNQIVVSGVNKQPVYRSPSTFLQKYESGKFEKISVKYKEMPININRVKLRRTKNSRKPIEVKIIKNKNGKRKRIDINTKKEIKIPKRKNASYAVRNMKKGTGEKDTPADLLSEITYNGEDFTQVASFFIKNIKNKEAIEQKLILKDK